MHRKELELAVHQLMLENYIQGKGPHIEFAQVRAVVEALFKVLIAVTVQGERVTIQNLCTFIPAIMAKNARTPLCKRQYNWYRNIGFRVHLKLSSNWKQAFTTVAKILGRLIDWEEIEQNGKARLRAKSRMFSDHERVHAKASRERRESYKMPFVPGGDDRAPAVLPEPWLRALREARKRELKNAEGRRKREEQGEPEEIEPEAKEEW